MNYEIKDFLAEMVADQQVVWSARPGSLDSKK
jgi:hypothetical protein